VRRRLPQAGGLLLEPQRSAGVWSLFPWLQADALCIAEKIHEDMLLHCLMFHRVLPHLSRGAFGLSVGRVPCKTPAFDDFGCSYVIGLEGGRYVLS